MRDPTPPATAQRRDASPAAGRLKQGNPKNKCFAFGLGCCSKSAKDCTYVHEMPNKEEIAFRDKYIKEMRAANKPLPWEAKSSAAAPAPKAKAKSKAKAKAKSKTPCRHYTPGKPGSCSYGDECIFAHQD